MLWEVGSMMILIAILIAVVAISLMMTVLVASTRTFGAFDQSVFGARTPAPRPNGPSWLDLDRAPPPSRVPNARAPQHEIPALPVPAPVRPGALATTGSRATVRPVGEAQPPAARGSGRINPNTWGRVRAEVGALKTATDHVRSASA